jgi:type I restriction enzyme S subunit
MGMSKNKTNTPVPKTPTNSAAPSGYKRTAAGVIPVDWNILTIGDMAEIKNGATPTTQVSAYWNGTIPWCTPSDITRTSGKYLFETNRNITQTGLGACATNLLPPGALLLCSRATIGEIKVAATKICTNQGFKSLICKPGFSNEFLYYLILTLKPLLVEKAIGSTFLEIGKRDLASITVAVPHEHEQNAIAEALSDVDGLIGALEKLITKKRAIKQAAMQQLLTGKTRLPGFDAQWKERPLKEISSMHGRIGWQGLKQSEFTQNADDPFLITGVDFRATKIDWDAAYHVTRERYDIAPQIQLSIGDVLMTKDGTIGKTLYVDTIPYPGKATLNSHLLVFRPIANSYVPKFLLYQMRSKRFDEHIEQNKSGSTFFGLSQEATGKYLVLLPTIDEQASIAEVLSDMDAEIEALEQRRDKTQKIKQGMMQQLLTGRVRLVNGEATA